MDWQLSTIGTFETNLARGKIEKIGKYLVLATAREIWSKYDDFKLFFPQNMATLTDFFPKKSFVLFV